MDQKLSQRLDECRSILGEASKGPFDKWAKSIENMNSGASFQLTNRDTDRQVVIQKQPGGDTYAVWVHTNNTREMIDSAGGLPLKRAIRRGNDALAGK